jgi:perosamine synthetase
MKIWALCKERGIWLCEDNCESYGAVMQIDDDTDIQKLQGATQNAPVANVGSMSTMSVVSVRSEKMVGVGEGGAILSKDSALVSKARWWCSRTPVRGCGLWRVYEHENVGQNFRLPELLGAVGLAACENLPVMIGRKRQIHAWYMEELRDMPFIKFQEQRPLDQPVWWLNCIKLELEKLPEELRGKYEMRVKTNRNWNIAEAIGMQLMKNHPHIEMRPAFFPLHMMSCFKQGAQECPNSEDVYATLMCVPSSAQLEHEDVKEVCAAFRESVTEVLGAL